MLFKKLPESFTNAQEKTYSNNIFSENAAKPPPLCLPPRERLCLGIAVFSYRSLPHWGRGTASAVDRVLSYIVDLRRISPLVFHTARTLSGSLRSSPFPRGEGFVHRYCFLHVSYIRSDNARKAASSYRCLPHWGRGDRAAVDRVLSYIVDLRRISSLIFHTASTLSGSLCSPPSPRGEGCVHRYCFPHISYTRFDDMGIAVDRVFSFIVDLRCISPLSFIPLEPYPARFARHLPHAGKALCREKRHPRIAAFPIGEGGPRQRWIGCSRKRRT